MNKDNNTRDAITKSKINSTQENWKINDKLHPKNKIVEKIIRIENIKISAVKILIPFIFYLYEMKILRKQFSPYSGLIKLSTGIILYPVLLSIEFFYLLINFYKSKSKDKKFIFKEIGKKFLNSAFIVLTNFGFFSLLKQFFHFNNILVYLITESISLFLSNFFVETLTDKILGTESKERVLIRKIMNSEEVYKQALNCFRAEATINLCNLNEIKQELFETYNPGRFKNDDLKRKARMKLEKYQKAYDIIKSRIKIKNGI